VSARFALIIGNKEYDDPVLRGLRAPEYDVNDLATLLEDTQIGGFQVARLLDRSFAEVRSAVSDFLTDRQPDDTLLIYFSGHGIKSRSGTVYLAVRDTRQKSPAALGIDAHFLRTEMQQCYCQRQILILDCCYSGAFAKLGDKGANDTVDTKSEFMGGGFGQVVITATNAVQVGIEADRVVGDSKYSLFTHYLIEGLRTGEADGAGNAGGVADGVITDAELYEYAYQRVDRTKEQLPQRLVQQSGLAIQLARNLAFDRMSPELRELLKRAKSTVRFERADAARALGDFLIDADPDVVAYARKALTACLADPVPSVKQAAEQALGVGGSQPTMIISPVPSAPSPEPASIQATPTDAVAASLPQQPAEGRPDTGAVKAREQVTRVERESSAAVGTRADPSTIQDPKRRAETHLARGNELWHKGEPDAAATQYREALLADPESAEAHLQLGSVLASQLADAEMRMRYGLESAGEYARLDPEGPGEEFREAIRLEPDHFEAHRYFAIYLSQRGRSREAIEQYREALRLEPESGPAHLGLAKELEACGEKIKGIEEYRLAGRFLSEHYIRFEIGKALERLGDLEAALEFFRALASDPKTLPDYQAAYERLTKAVLEERLARKTPSQKEPKVATAEDHYKLGSDLAKRGELARAEAEFREAIRLNPGYADAHFMLSRVVSFDSNRLTEARDEYRIALKLNPDDEEAQNRLDQIEREIVEKEKREKKQRAERLVRQGNELREADNLIAAAKEYREAALSVDNENAEAHYHFGAALAELRSVPYPTLVHEEVISDGVHLDSQISEAFEAAIRLRPQYFEAHLARAREHSRAGARASAAREFGKAARLRPDSLAAHLGLANELEQLQLNDSRAVTDCQERARKNPESHEAAVLKEMGEAKDANALAEYRKAAKLKPNSDERFEIAQALERLGDHEPALEHYQALAAADPDRFRAAQERVARAVQEEIRKRKLDTGTAPQWKLGRPPDPAGRHKEVPGTSFWQAFSRPFVLWGIPILLLLLVSLITALIHFRKKWSTPGSTSGGAAVTSFNIGTGVRDTFEKGPSALKDSARARSQRLPASRSDLMTAENSSSATKTPKRIRVAGRTQSLRLIEQPKPDYPAEARSAHVEGTVKLRAIINADGTVKDLTLLSGNPLLVDSAINAVKRWRYSPTELNGEPVEVVTQIDVDFKMRKDLVIR
jgi:TonB family protein